MPDIVAIGEALVEIMRPRVGIPLDTPDDFVGPFPSGAPAIFADQAARLGHTIAFVGAVGQDPFGDMLYERLHDDGVEVDYLVRVPNLATGVAFVTYNEDGSRQFIFHIGNAASGQMPPVPPELLAEARWLHVCGSTLAASDQLRRRCLEAVQMAVDAGCDISFDPNLRPELLPGGYAQFREVCWPVLSRASLVLPGREELAALTRTDDPLEGARALLQAGARMVAVKLGGDGCLVCTHEETVRVEPFPVRAVDPTGAGDCFDAAVVCGLIEEKGPAEIGELANACGALGASERGPMEGAKFRPEVDAFIRDNSGRSGPKHAK